MPPKKQKQKSVSFDEQLVLFRFFLHLFGKEAISSFSSALNNTDAEGFDENQNTLFYVWLRDFCPHCQIPKDRLRIYDENICRYVKRIGEKRGGLKLKYFQYLALLFTEIFLDRYFSSKSEFIEELNEYIAKLYSQSLGLIGIPAFTEKSLNKLAYMCATGSGKTLLMHINILQFLHYFNRAKRQNSHLEINNIIVLAPNENMALQHLDELKLSNISAGLFNKDDLLYNSDSDVLVIDMNKLREEGKAKTVSVDQFEQNNLVLVDEGHRGMSGNVWYDYRTRLAAEGFSFEYSATFKQALNAGNAKEKQELLDEYSHSIIMDYSYKFFYEDGYGKDYRIYNLKAGIDEETRQIYLVGCLVSFYQQMKVYLDNPAALSDFNVEKPLLVFVGNRVTTSTSEAELTDVEEVINFMDDFLRNKHKSIERIRALFYDDTGLVDGNGNQLFQNIFQPLQDVWGTTKTLDPEVVYLDILKTVFNASVAAGEFRLHLVIIKQVSGEIALRVGSDNDYFGVINIGDTTKLAKLCESNEIVVKSDEFISDSFFRQINSKKSSVNVLIGSRKFTEGWNSWRVSTMGLINFAKGEGSQAIQLFGRGVRLRGYNGTLKRSSQLSAVKIPKNLSTLETLTIFGLKAQYMEEFRSYLQDGEGMPANDNIYEFRLPVVKRTAELAKQKLHVLRISPGKDFKKQSARLILDVPDEGLMKYITRTPIVIDCRAKVQTIESAGSFHLERTAVVEPQNMPIAHLDLLDYQRIYEALQEYKNEKFYFNISIDINRLQNILATDGICKLIIPANHLYVDSMEKLIALTDYSILVLQSYMDKFFVYHKAKWEAPHMAYQEIAVDDNNFVEEYKITYTPVTKEDKTAVALDDFLKDLQSVLDERKHIPEYMRSFENRLFAFDFRHHLYAPLICIKSAGLQLQISPVALNNDERRFVDYLKEYTEKHAVELDGKSLYLLRNKSKSGIGFFEADNFYPDYILWLDTPGRQYISFIDPKGLTRVPWDSPKILFSQKIKERQAQMEQPTDKQIVLNSFIMSGTPAANLKMWWPGKSVEDWNARNVFCLDDETCVEKMFEKILKDDNISAVSYIRSNKAKSSRNTYHQTLISELLKSGENNTRSLEDLVACWAVLSKPESVAEALGNRDDVKSWKGNYPDKIKDDESIITALRYMIDRSMISISKDLKVTLRNGIFHKDAQMDAAMSTEAVTILHQTKPQSFCFAFDKFISADFLTAARRGDFAHAA